MSVAACPTCGEQFERDQPWKKTCLPCWQEKKRAEEPTAGAKELLAARLEVFKLNAELTALRRELGRSQTIEPEMLRRLTMLCHPDRHNNSPASTKATAWLLEQRT